jgi:2-desacetyl-2-hydroxyethyl bacteriochlorophyllide A dehydrogenase
MSAQTGTMARSAMMIGPRDVEVREVELPPVGPGDVLLRTLYTGISAGTEMNVYRGRAAQWRTRRDPETGLFEPSSDPEWTYPLAYGYAAVSEVEEAGADVSGVRVGDLVFSYTAHASAAVVAASEVVALPDLADPRVGVLNANLNTAYNGLLDAHPRLGDTVVVSGLGVIGLLLVQMLARAGIHTIAIDGVAERRGLAERFGAAVTLEPGRGAAAEIRSLTGNRGADIVIEVSGASQALNEAIRIVGYGGTVVAMSWYGGTFESLDLSGEFHHNRPRIIASQVGGLPPGIGSLWTLARRQETVSRLMQELDLSPLLTHEMDGEKASEAYALVDSRPPELIQCVLAYAGEARR